MVPFDHIDIVSGVVGGGKLSKIDDNYVLVSHHIKIFIYFFVFFVLYIMVGTILLKEKF